MKVLLEKCIEYCAYSQTHQTSSIKFSLLNRTNTGFKELHVNVRCREYFGDAVVAAYLDCDLPLIYGYKLSNKRAAIDETILSIYPGSTENKDLVLSKLHILNKIEKKMGIGLSVIYKVKGDNDVVVIIGDKKWMSSPLLISIYTLIIRSFTYFTNRRIFKNHIRDLILKYSGNDKSAFECIFEAIDIEHLLVNIDKVLGDNPLTGYNDLSLYCEVMMKKPLTKDHSYTLPSTYQHSTNKKITWNFYNNHSSHGIIHFIDNYKYLKFNNNFQHAIGEEWAYNYYRLINKIKT